MRPVLLFLVLLLAGIGCEDPDAKPERVVVPSVTESYVLSSETCGDYFVVQARINGKGPYPLLMDSGAGATLLDPRVIQETRANKSIDSLEIGKFKAFDFGIRSHEMDLLSAALGRRIDGILGHPVFNPLLLTYDYGSRQLSIAVGSLDSSESVGLRKGVNRPYVRAEVDNRQFWMLVDTGSSRGLTLDDLTSFPLAAPPTRTGGRARVDGLHRVYTARLNTDLGLGGHSLERPFVTESASTHLVGQEVLHHFALTFDHPSGLMRFAALDSTVMPIQASPVRISNFLADPLTGRIQHVFDETSGFEQGDIVLAIDGVPFSARNCPPAHPHELSTDNRLVQLVRGVDTLTVVAENRYLMP